MGKILAVLPIFIVLCYITRYARVQSSPIDQESLNELPQAIRKLPSPLVQVINASVDNVQLEDVEGNVTNTSLTDIENDNLTYALQLKYRERKKQERLTIIQAQILHSLGMDRQPNISSSVISNEQRRKFTMLFETMHNGNNSPLELSSRGFSSSHLSKLQSFYPACNPPINVERSLWESDETFRIFYDTPINRQSTNSDIRITLAKLRIYKIANIVDPNFIGWNPSHENLPRYNQLETLINSNAANSINVNVYQFMKPLRTKKREKRRLIDSRTIFNDYQGWVEFNVSESLNYWLHHSNKNFGFDIQVEDAYGNRLNPNLYFHNMNCTSETPREPPFPNIKEFHPEMSENESSLFDNEVYPTLDLQTAELQRDFFETEAFSSRYSDRSIRKRSTKEEVEEPCHAEDEYVSFAEMGLDNYILWPPGVMWTFCEGGCDWKSNFLQRQQSFYAAWMQRLFRITPKNLNSSCVAASKESLTVTLNEDGANVETVLEDIVPTSCSCRST